MQTPTSVVFTANRTDGRAWLGPLGAVGSNATLVEKPAEIGAEVDFVVANATDENRPAVYEAVGKLGSEAAALVVLPQPNLLSMAETLQISSVKAAVVHDYVDSRLLTYISAKALWGDIFGVGKVLPWGVRVHSEAVTTHEERTQALQSVTRFAKSLGLRSKYIEAIELVLDELLMNALYNAPVAANGRPLYNDVAATERGKLDLERPVILQVACDGHHFAASVRDGWGSLSRKTIIDYLLRCSQANAEQIERKTSGAGLGLYLAANNVTEFIANLAPGVATEFVCVFDLSAPRQQLMHLGVYEEVGRPSGEGRPRRTGPTSATAATASPRRPAAPSRMVTMTLATAVLLLMVATFLLVLPTLQHGAKGSLEVTVTPPGSAVYIDGARRGEASPKLLVEDLSVAFPHAVGARRPGFQPAEEVVSLVKNRVQEVHLTLRQHKARVRVETVPPGATIIVNGKPSGLRTPAVLEGLDPGKALDLELKAHGHESVTASITPSVEETLVLQRDLPVSGGFAQLSVDSEPPGAQVFLNDVDTGQVTPMRGHTIRPGTYRLKLVVAGRPPWEQEVELKAGQMLQRRAELTKGGTLTLYSSVPVRASIENQFSQVTPIVGRLLPAGTFRMRVRSESPLVDHFLDVHIKAGGSVTRRLQFGFVATKRATLKIKMDRRAATKAAFLPGRQEVKLLDTKTGQTRTQTVEVIAKSTVVLE
jgi:hypothetical protein